ncbi:MAG: hypothetical protein EOL87_12545 [Spartobacteria bacterium]|nr:hypothetical protein [Spartobacteria bacterium]
MKHKRVLLAGASIDPINTNALLRQHVEEGFVAILGRENVYHVAFEFVERGILHYEPDLVLFFGSCMPDTSEYHAMAHLCRKKNIQLGFWLHDDPYEIDCSEKIVDLADFIFTNDKGSVPFYDHERVFHLPLAASPSHHFREISTEKECDFFFCGVAFPNRIAFFNDMVAFLSAYNVRVQGAEWPQTLPFARNRRLFSEEQVDCYARSRLTFNLGRCFNLANHKYMLTPTTPGPRTFEAAMAGAVQIYLVESLEICEYYEPDEEILLVDSPKDVKQIAERFLDDPESLRRIGAQAQKKTMDQHRYQHRAEVIMQVVWG